MSNENISFDDFAEAFDSDIDYQTDGADEVTVEEDTATEETGEETTGEQTETGGDGEQTEESAEQTEDTTPSEKEAEKVGGETFTLKVNKEEKTYSREEVISLAQKGADYDRVKEQLERSRQSAGDLQKQLDEQKDAMEVISDLAKESGVDIPQMLRTLRMGMLKKQGLSEDAANERLLRMDAEKENAALKAAAAEAQPKETGAQRAQREIAEFREAYPDVPITQELVDKLMDEVQGGKTLTAAYRNYERSQAEAKIAELQRQLAAQKQNAENRASSPGSQKDSGGRRTKSDYDDFMEAFG